MRFEVTQTQSAELFENRQFKHVSSLAASSIKIRHSPSYRIIPFFFSLSIHKSYLPFYLWAASVRGSFCKLHAHKSKLLECCRFSVSTAVTAQTIVAQWNGSLCLAHDCASSKSSATKWSCRPLSHFVDNERFDSEKITSEKLLS